MTLFKRQYFIILILVLFATNRVPALCLSNGDNSDPKGTPPGKSGFLPDTVNVFKVAKDVSEIFVNAVKSPVYNDIFGDTSILNQIFLANFTSNDIANSYKDAIDQQIRAKKGDIGLNLKGDYTENFTPGFSVDEDLTFKRRFYVGLEWDIINGGLFDASNKIHQLKMESILKEYEALEYAEKENYRYLFNYINYLFNQKKIEILEERRGLVAKQLNFTKELYYLHYVGWEKVLQYQAKVEDIDHQIYQIKSFNKHIPASIPDSLLASGLSADQLPLFDVNLDSLMKIYYEHHAEDTVTQIKLAIYRDNIKWWKDITLKPYVRYNIYMDEFNVSKNYGSAGVTLSVPLRFHNKGKLMRSQEAIYRSEQMKELEGGDNELVNIYAEFGYKLKQIKEFYYRKLLNDELIRKELVKKDYHDVAFNPVFTLGLIDDKKAMEAEIIDIKKLMYINLVRLAFYLENRKPTNFITVLKPEDFVGRYSGSVKMFVNQTDMQKFSATDLANFLWKNEFIDAIVETSGDSLSEQLNVMLDKTRLANVFFSIMTRVPVQGSYPNVAADISTLQQWNKDRIIGRHYEIDYSSPSSLDESAEMALSDWLNSIPQNESTGGIRLSIGIPSNLSINLLNKIFDKFDLVFVRERGMPDREKIQETFSREISMDRDRLVLSMDGTDFVDRMHVDNFMSNLYENLRISNFAFASYESMHHLDTRVINHTDSPESLIASIQDQIYLSESKVPAETERVEEKVKEQAVVYIPATEPEKEIVTQETVTEEATQIAEQVVVESTPLEVTENQSTPEVAIVVEETFTETEAISPVEADSNLVSTELTEQVVEAPVEIEIVEPVNQEIIENTAVAVMIDSVQTEIPTDSADRRLEVVETIQTTVNESVETNVVIENIIVEEKYYRIQIAASKVKLSENFLMKFKAEDIREITKDGYFKYTTGSFSTEREALKQLRLYKEKSGNTGAFIVTY